MVINWFEEVVPRVHKSHWSIHDPNTGQLICQKIQIDWSIKGPVNRDDRISFGRLG